MTPPQTYELTTFSTIVVMIVAAIFFYLCIKLLLMFVQWAINVSSKENADETKPAGVGDESSGEMEEEDNTIEPSDLDTKKAN